MNERRIYEDGERVEVWRENRQRWVPGIILAYEKRDGVWKYFIQLSGYMSAHVDDTNCWFTADELRS